MGQLSQTASDTSDIIFAIAQNKDHFEQILVLQRRNHLSSLNAEQQQSDGFVFAEHNLELLEKMAAHVPQVIALAGGRVIAYNLAMTPTMESVLPSLEPMFAEFRNWSYRGKPLMDYQFVVGGQVCVDEAFRGRGLIRELYGKTRDLVGPGYELCVTEISTRNVKSLKAHQNMGFEVLGVYNDGTENWNLVVWDFLKSS